MSQMVLSDCVRAQHTQRASEEFGLTPPGAYPVCGAICTLHRVSVENMSQQVKHTDTHKSLYTRANQCVCVCVWCPHRHKQRQTHMAAQRAQLIMKELMMWTWLIVWYNGMTLCH